MVANSRQRRREIILKFSSTNPERDIPIGPTVRYVAESMIYTPVRTSKFLSRQNGASMVIKEW
jgi:hypothetical protein